MRHPPAYDRTFTAFHYAFPLDSMIKALKFDERLILAEFLADALATRISVLPDCLVALPLHPSRLRMRGFNQSQLLAERLSRTLGVPLLSDAALRIRDTPPQSTLPWRARSRNMLMAFALGPGLDVQGKHVAIVDDVMTSGASIGTLAGLMKQAGASEISACVIARTLPHGTKT